MAKRSRATEPASPPGRRKNKTVQSKIIQAKVINDAALAAERQELESMAPIDGVAVTVFGSNNGTRKTASLSITASPDPLKPSPSAADSVETESPAAIATQAPTATPRPSVSPTSPPPLVRPIPPLHLPAAPTMVPSKTIRLEDLTPPANQPPLLFESAWEVCWQLGGIYTVLRSKASAMIARWEDRYCLIGPYNPATAAVEFEETPTDGVIRQALDRLRATGVPCHFGRWLIPGRPRVILLDYRARFGSLDSDKYKLWADHGITSPPNDGEVNEVVAFGFVVTEFFRMLSQVAPGRTILGHFHEWMGGVAVPRIAHERLPITTVFTTHATLLGRYLASDHPNFYENLNNFNADERAAHYNILPRHQIEKAAAHASTVFTTVSEVTALESEKLLGRVPDAILPNGLNIQKFAALHEFQNLHARYKDRINEFVMGHFFPSHTFDLDRTLYFFTSGRYEFRNKGLDMFIEAMYRLNVRLKETVDPPTIVAFIITRAPVRNINVGVLQSQMQLEDLRSYCEQVQETMGRALFMAAAAGRMISMKELLPEDSVVRLKRTIHAARRYNQPNIVTHDLIDDQNDPVLKHLRHRHMFNASDDPVKIVFHPEFVTATSPLIGLDYEQFVRGCHLGLFTSYYEPWGYTPMESVALGVPAVTTNLSGFGAYVERHVPNHEDQGIFVMNRRTASFDEGCDDLVDRLLSFVKLNRRQRIELRNKTERMSEIFDWSKLVRHYHDAHDLAIERTGGRRPGRVEVRVI